MGDQRLGWRCVEIRTLPTLLPTGPDDLERTVLSPAGVDAHQDAFGSLGIPVLVVPFQFRELQVLQGTVRVQEAIGRDAGNSRRPEIKNGSK